MKKICSIILLCGILLCCFSSCQKKDYYPPYTVFNVGGATDGESTILQTSEVDLENQLIVEEEKVGTEKTIQINGESLTLTYDKTIYCPYFNNDRDYYVDNPVPVVSFQINLQTGRCVSYSNGHLRNQPLSSEVKTKAECLAIAKDFFKQFVDDVDAYVLTYEKYDDDRKNLNPLYVFSFHRKVGHILTEERIDINVLCTGSVVFYHTSLLGEMKDVKAPDEETIQTAQEHLDQKLTEIFASDEYHVNYFDPTLRLAKMKNGQLALIYRVTATLTFPKEPLRNTHEFVTLLIYL